MLALFAFALALQPAIAQPRPPASVAEITLSFAPLVKAAAPAVVNVYASRSSGRARSVLSSDPFFERFFQRDPREMSRQSVGSGVIVAREGIIVTNHHVVEGMTEIRVALSDRREFAAEIALLDPKTDLAILRIQGEGRFPSLEIGNSDALSVGDIVLAIGNPFGVGQTVTQGIVSALARTHVGISDYQFFIQTDAAINPGNSGGALIDMTGRLVGINTAIFSRSGGSHGIGFAIPSNMVRLVVDSARKGGQRVQRPWFGATLQPITPDLAEDLRLPKPAGALIADLHPGGPAVLAGLERLDVITAVDGAGIEDPDSFLYRFTTKPLGARVTLSVIRNARALEVPVGLAAAPDIPARDPTPIRANAPISGATFVNLNPAVREEFSLGAVDRGIMISTIEPGTPAERVGFRVGDVILAINGERLASTRELAQFVRSRPTLWRITARRGNETFTTTFRG